MCIESVNYQVLVNGERVRPINHKRDFRQGDPLTPCFFIMCAEGLCFLLKKTETSGDIHGVKVCRRASILTHLLFADDCFLFYRANLRKNTKLREILQYYEAMSGQTSINFKK
jgi:hypothetical protein